MPARPAPVTPRDGALDALRTDLAAAPYTPDAVAAALGPVATAALEREQALPALRGTLAQDGVPGTLLRLFLLGAPVTRRALDAALPRTGTDGAARLGLVEAAGQDEHDAVRALVDLQPYAAQDDAGEMHWWIASDRGELATGTPVAADHVLGVGGASTTLARVTIRSPRRRTLDLGTGCGVQALHAARHSEHVVATDISRRALAFAGFNAALAGARPELRHGSLLEPVRDGGFDLVVSNPPFVISPGAPRFEYRDGGRSGDDLVRDLVLGVGEVLAPGGVAQLLGNWEHHAGQGWRERVEGWLAAADEVLGMDGWVVQRDVLDPAQYAETWLRDAGTTPDRDPAGWAAGYTAWLDDFADRGVEAVGLGIITLRRRAAAGAAGPALRRVEEITGPAPGALGSHIAAVLAADDWLAARDDVALADARLVVAHDVTEERFHTPGSPDPSVILLRQGGGFGRAVRAGTATAAVTGACDGELTVGQLAGGVAALLDRPAEDVLGEVLPDVRGLVRDGFLVPLAP